MAITANITKGTKIASHTYLVKSAAAFMTAIAKITFLKRQIKIKNEIAAIDQLVYAIASSHPLLFLLLQSGLN
jgi:hypothetical protein